MDSSKLVTENGKALDSPRTIGILLLQYATSQHDLLDPADGCHAVQLKVGSGLHLLDVPFELLFALLLDDGYLIEDGFHNQVVQALVNKSVRLG